MGDFHRYGDAAILFYLVFFYLCAQIYIKLDLHPRNFENMLLIKTNFQINDHFLNDLLRLINGKIEHVSSLETEISLESPYKLFNDLLMFISTDSSYYRLSVRSLIFYNENIDNDVTTLKISFEADSKELPIYSKGTFLGGQAFKIHKIQIYGEERIRTWSEIKKINYFNKKIDTLIGDYYFNNTVISFESLDGQKINIFAYRQGIELNFEKKLNIDNDFYLIPELKMEEDFVNDELWTNIQRIKCHYEIDENGVKKHINQEITLHG